MIPADHPAVAAHVGPAAVEFQINNAIARDFDGQIAVGIAETAVHGGNEPHAVRCPVQVGEMDEFPVGVLPSLTSPQVIYEESLGGKIGTQEAVRLTLHKGDLLSARAPAGLAAIISNPGA